MGAPFKGVGMGGCGRQDVREFLQVSGTGSATLKVIGVGDIPKYCENDGRVSPPVYQTNDWAEDDTAGRWDLGEPTSGGNDGGNVHGGGGDLRRPLP